MRLPCSSGGKIDIWNDAGEHIKTLTTDSAAIYGMILVSYRGTSCIINNNDNGDIRFWDYELTPETACLRILPAEPSSPLTNIDCDKFAYVGKDKKVYIFDCSTNTNMPKSFNVAKSLPNSLTAITPKTIACGCRNGVIYLWNWNNGTIEQLRRQKVAIFSEAVYSLAALPYGVLVSTHSDNKIIFWDCKTKRRIYEFKEFGASFELTRLTQGRLAIVTNDDWNFSLSIYQFPGFKPTQHAFE